MGVDTKSLKTRIKSVDSTLHLTKAMGLVASAKIRSATAAMMNSREYSSSMGTTIDMLSAARSCEKSEYMRKPSGEKTCLVVVAGDRGLAGGYNSNVFKMADSIGDAEIIPIGKRAVERYGGELLKAEGYSYSSAIELSKQLCTRFKSGELDRVGIVSTRYLSMMTQQCEITWLLPLERKDRNTKAEVLFEPDEITILEAVIEEYVSAKIIEAVREGFNCEVVARRFAMDSAGKNAREMIDNLTLEYNRARQGAITQEITEIVAGSGV